MGYSLEIRAYFKKLSSTIDKIDVQSINNVMNVLEKVRIAGKSIFIMGNGGSAATASHFVVDFNKGASSGKNMKYKFICLNDNVPTVMALANDLSYDEIFQQQLISFLSPGDAVIGISGSGNSMNVIKAIEYANTHEGITIGMSGYDGGKLKKIAKHNIHVPIDDMQITEDLHMVLDHCMMQILSNSSEIMDDIL